MIKNIEKYFIYFMLYSFAGWFYEVFLEVVVYRWGFTNRGVLFGPYCPIYGIGALIFLFIVNPLIKDRNLKTKLMLIPLVFVLCMLIATALELATTYILEYFTGSWPWQTYGDYKINFQSRIALSPSIRFGLGGVIILYALQPLAERVVSVLKYRKAFALLLALIFAVDIIFSIICPLDLWTFFVF